MRSLSYLLTLPTVEALGWTLLHFVWQGALIALILAILLWLFKNRNPSLRYALSCASLALMLACPLATYPILFSRLASPTAPEVLVLPQNQLAAPVMVDAAAPVAASPVVFAPEGGATRPSAWYGRYFKPYLPYLVVFWCLGVLLLSIRLLGGLWFLRRLRTHLTKPVSTALTAQLHGVAERLGLARPVQLRESLAVSVPLVIGWLKPLVLMPSSALSGLRPEQLEMILAHELAHIRRHDYLVNLLQNIVETLLFYHPLVWWVSGRIRAERESCCDDLAVRVCGHDRTAYARALADLDDLRPRLQLAQAATGGSLLQRITRLVDRARPRALDPRQWLVGMATILASLLVVVAIGTSLTFAQGDEVTLRLAVTDPQGRPSEPYVLEFIEQVKTLSDGKITIEPTWFAEAGQENAVIRDVRTGVADLGLVGSRAFNGEGVTNLDALQAPFLIDNDALAEAVATSDTAKQMLEGMSAAGVVGLTLWPEDMRHPFAIDPQPPFLSPEDFAGMDIRTTTSGISAALVKALGANPVGFESTTYQGAESGLRQGGSLSGTQTATGNVTFFSKYQVLFANGTAFEKLSDEQKTILQEAAKAAQTKAIAEHPRELDAATVYCADGGTVVLASDEQIAAFEKAAQPVFDQIEQDPANASYIAAIRALKASTVPSAGATACEPPTIQAGPTPSSDTEVWSEGLPPNGIWQVELTAEDLEAAGLPQASAVDWASTQTLTLLDGEGTWFFQKPEANIYCKSTYFVVDEVVRFNYTADCSAQVHDMRWRLEEDGLQLKLVATQRALDAPFKASFAAKPWQKVGEPTPDARVWDTGLPPNGTWQAEATPEDFLAMGFVPSYAALLGGVYTWTFQDGKATFHTETQDSVACTANYAVAGEVVRFNYTGGNCAQDIADMQWRLEDDGLHMHIVDHLYNFRLDDLNLPSVFLDFGGHFEANTFKKID